MLRCSCQFLSQALSNANGSQLRALQQQLASRQYTSTFIRQRFINVLTSSTKLYHHRYVDTRWLYTSTPKFDAKNKQGKHGQEEKGDAMQRIVELDEHKLGHLKERVLNIDEAPISIGAVATVQAVVDEEEKVVNKKDVKKEVTKDKVKEEKKLVENVASVVKKLSTPPSLPPKKKRVDRSVSSLERNFITPIRAKSDFLLKQSHLEELPKTERRSPYEFEPSITVYWRKDVEAKALEVWGSKEALLKELFKRKINQQNVFTVKKRLRDLRREVGSQSQTYEKEGLSGASGKVVVTAIVINGVNFFFKLLAWMYTGSHSMLSECFHSATDTLNQMVLAYGIHKSVQDPNSDHPYGYSNMKYVSSLVSGVAIFFIGAGLSAYHGINGLLYPDPIESFYWAYFILGGSLVSEGATLLVAINSIKKGALEKRKTFREYVMSGHDPTVNVVLMEDLAAVLGVMCAGTCMGLTSYLNNSVFDAIGSLLIGGLLGGVAWFIIKTNIAAVIGRSIPQENLEEINSELESDIMVRAVYDFKGIDMGNNIVRYKAELDFDGRELTRYYLDKHDLNVMLEEVQKMQNVDELESFLLKHGENIVDMLGQEIDRIELKLRKKHPEIRHCDLEIV